MNFEKDNELAEEKNSSDNDDCFRGDWRRLITVWLLTAGDSKIIYRQHIVIFLGSWVYHFDK